MCTWTCGPYAREGPHYSWPAPFLSNRIQHKFCMPSRCLCPLAKHSNCVAYISRLGDIQLIVEAHEGSEQVEKGGEMVRNWDIYCSTIL